MTAFLLMTMIPSWCSCVPVASLPMGKGLCCMPAIFWRIMPSGGRIIVRHMLSSMPKMFSDAGYPVVTVDAPFTDYLWDFTDAPFDGMKGVEALSIKRAYVDWWNKNCFHGDGFAAFYLLAGVRRFVCLHRGFEFNRFSCILCRFLLFIGRHMDLDSVKIPHLRTYKEKNTINARYLSIEMPGIQYARFLSFLKICLIFSLRIDP